MNHIVSVAIIHSTDNLLEESPSILLLQFAVLDDVVKQFPARDVLHYHEDVRGGADDLVQLDDVGMTEQLQVLDFSSDLSDNVKILDLLPKITSRYRSYSTLPIV